MQSMLLNGSDWTLTGYWQHQWKLMDAPDLGQWLRQPIPPMPATVPGAVHADLLRAGVIADWQDGLNAEKCEWVNNREWALSREVTVPADWDGPIALECDGLDYSGCVMVDGKQVGRFEGTHLRHCFDLTDKVSPGQTFRLEFLFDLAPAVEGVYGYTSTTRIFKPRFGYYWDWCPRLVNVGIWQDVRLVCRDPAIFSQVRVLARVKDDLTSGRVRVVGQVAGEVARVRYELRDPDGRVVAAGEESVGPQMSKRTGRRDEGVLRAQSETEVPLNITLRVPEVRRWWPATLGEQALYDLTVELIDRTGRANDRIERTVGFRQVRWLPNPGAPPGAKPYLCEVNGVPLFIRGINWVPLSPFHGTVTATQYETVLRQYWQMNVNLLRVWGGAVLETPTFYDLCDRLGLMVWQELPLSSSGIENWPPEDPDVIEHLQTIAAEYVERRGHHASHVLWCGGNELQGAMDGSKQGIGKPVDELHPLMARWQTLLEELDPGKRFQASSPSGPTFYAHADNYGKQMHHQVHGPWGNLPSDERYDYWNRDDSLFRSESGSPGCASLESLERHKGDQSLWPPRDTNRHWLVPTAAWIPWNDVNREFGPIADEPASLPTLVKASRYLQAESYRYAAEATRRRYPTCSGYIIWMGHDCVHNLANNSVIEIDGSTKPAYDVLQRAYGRRHVSMKHDAISYAAGEALKAEVWVHEDTLPGAAQTKERLRGSVIASMRGMDGRELKTQILPLTQAGDSACAGTIDWPVPELAEKLFIVELSWQYADETVSNRYVLSQQAKHPLAPLLQLKPAELQAHKDGQTVRVRNVGTVAAVGVRLVKCSADKALLTTCNNVVLLPNEEAVIAFEVMDRTEAGASAGEAGLAIEAMNIAAPLQVG